MSNETVTVRAYLSHSYRKPADLFKLSQEELANCLAITTTNMDDTEGWIQVGTAEVRVNLTPLPDLTANTIRTLRAQVKTIRADAERKAMALEGEIQKLLAITNEVQA